MQYLQEFQSLGEMFQKVCTYWGEKTAILQPVKGKYHSHTYSDYLGKVFTFANIFHSLGLKSGDKIALCSENCFEWALIDWAAQTLGAILVPIYPTLPADQIHYIVKDSDSKILILGTKDLKTKCAHGLEIPVYLIQSDSDEKNLKDIIPSHSLDRSIWEKNMKSIKKDDVATIIYTSGTTGKPKGVMLTHENFLSVCRNVKEMLPVESSDVFLSFLPLSHVYERFAGHIMPTLLGCTIGYVQSIATFAGDMLTVKPTIMLCVPRFLESMRNKIIDGVSKQSAFKKFLFGLAYGQGLKRTKKQFAPLYQLMDRLVGAKIRMRTGGRLRFFVSGGAALSPHIEEFFRAFNVKIVQGYGLTEATAFSFINHPDNIKIGTVGKAAQCLEVKLAEDKEILLKGASVMKGYYNLPKETEEAIDKEGWFHTGDIGELEKGFLKITDRKKDILVLGNGKNVVPQPIENLIKQSEWVEEAVLFGEGMEYVCALIVPNKERLLKWAKEKNFESKDWKKFLQIREVKAHLKKELDKVNLSLASFEKVKKFELVSESFTLESGILTPSLKVKRKIVQEKYADLIYLMQRHHI